MAFLTFSLGLEQKPSQLKSTALIRATAMPVCPCRRETGLLHSAEHLLLRGAGLLRVPSPVLDRHAADTTGSGPTASTQPPCLRFPPSDIEDLGGIKLGTSTAYPGSRGLGTSCDVIPLSLFFHTWRPNLPHGVFSAP